MNYNTLKASYPSITSPETIEAYAGPEPPYPKIALGLGGPFCKELGVAPGDGSSAGYRMRGQAVPPSIIYNDIDGGYPLTPQKIFLLKVESALDKMDM